MGRPLLYGADYSVYVRIARMVLEEKGVGYDLVPVDIFGRDGPPAWYLDHHPFVRIPAFEHDGFPLFETSAITRYVDEAFDGPPLQPVDPRSRARMNQITGLIDSYAYRAMVWDVAVERLEGDPPDEERIGTGLGIAGTALRALTKLKVPGGWLQGDQITLADLHAAPVIDYFVKVDEGRARLAAFPQMESWWLRISERQSFVTTAKSE